MGEASEATLPGCKPGTLPRLTFVWGEEPLQRREAEDAVRSLARARGADERVVHNVGTGFDWSLLTESTQSLSLFASVRLIEIYSETAAWGAAGGKALAALAEDANSPDFILVRCGELDSKKRAAAWFRKLEAAAHVVACRQPDASRLPDFLAARARRLGLDLPGEALDLVAARVEGNLLAAEQELTKLALLYPGQPVGLDEVRASLVDNARFDVFQLADAAADGDRERSQRILAALRETGTEPVLISWALGRLLRHCAVLEEARAARVPPKDLLRRLRLPTWTDSSVERCARRLGPGRVQQLLGHARRLDRTLKGADRVAMSGESWRQASWLVAAITDPEARVRPSAD